VTLFGVDCDDDNDLRRPGLVEVCDGLDNDCVGGLNFPGEDNDGDGYADCVDLMGQANFDCNDADPAVHPNAPEACDGLDSDCDGYVEDADNDGFVAVDAACTGGSMPATDCDDDRAETSPDAAETCNGVDDDCSGTDDDNNAIASCAVIVRSGEPLCAGGCTVTCAEPRADCDGLASSGCEVDLNQSPRHCGACGHTCSFGCDGGECVRATQVTGGLAQGCAVLETGAVRCWGSNFQGALGNDDELWRSEAAPVPVFGLDGSSPGRRALQVAADSSTTCALLETGAVQCWGSGVAGQLGNGQSGLSEFSTRPVDVLTVDGVLNTAVDVDVSNRHACAVLDSGAVVCWGIDENGVLGDGSNGALVRSTPVAVLGLGGAGPHAVRVALGPSTSCVLLDSGGVMCWGGEHVGDGGMTTRHAPVAVSGIDGVVSSATQLSVGADGACAALDDGSLVCWGDTPATVTGLTGGGTSVTDVAVGSFHRCVVLSDGTARCWGSDNAGQVGDGIDDGATEPLPTQVLGLDGVAVAVLKVSAILNSSCALSTEGEVYCWGAGVPSAVLMDPGTTVVSVDASGSGACAATDTGAAYCWGNDFFGQVGDGDDDEANEFEPVLVSGLDGSTTAVLEVAKSAVHACALLTTGAVRCWGDGTGGVLGNGSTAAVIQHSPVPVIGIDGVLNRAVRIAVGESHSCALLDTGAVRCWGYDADGQIGDGGTNNAPHGTPTDVVGLDGSSVLATRISAGEQHSCAVLESGQLRCWGDNSSGQLGHASVSTREFAPVVVSGIDGVSARAVAVSAGRHTCAILDSGALRCWGSDAGFQLGDGMGGGADERTPVAVVGINGILARATSVAAGTTHTCATLDDGSVRCWGSNTSGQLGIDDSGVLDLDTPAVVAEVSEASVVSAGQGTTCAISELPTLMCWGTDAEGQVGDGDDGQSDEVAPVRVRFP
jgi:alpha-tubulin suppressor-like RCC1 family protein